MQREGPLDTDSERLLSDREGLPRTVSLPLQHHPFEHLGAAPIALDHLEVDADAIARREAGQVRLQLAALDAVDDAAHEGARRRRARGWWRKNRAWPHARGGNPSESLLRGGVAQSLGTALALGKAPFAHPLVVARDEHLRDLPAAV